MLNYNKLDKCHSRVIFVEQFFLPYFLIIRLVYSEKATGFISIEN